MYQKPQDAVINVSSMYRHTYKMTHNVLYPVTTMVTNIFSAKAYTVGLTLVRLATALTREPMRCHGKLGYHGNCKRAVQLEGLLHVLWPPCCHSYWYTLSQGARYSVCNVHYKQPQTAAAIFCLGPNSQPLGGVNDRITLGGVHKDYSTVARDLWQ